MAKIKNLEFVFKTYLAPLVVSLLLAFIFIALIKCIPIAKTWLGLAADYAPDWYMNMYYNTVNDIAVCEDGVFPELVLLDLKENITRKDLADLIPLVIAGSPKVIGIDGTFSISDSYDYIQTDKLKFVLSQLPKSTPIVYAVVLNEPSAIPDSIMHYRGFVNSMEYNKYRFYQQGMPHFAYEMAKMAGCDVENIDTTSFLVNYRYKTFESIPVYSDFMEYGSYIQDKIYNKIVIIGGLNNRLDMHYVPFMIDRNTDKLAGSRILAYMLSSIITASSTCNYTNYKSFHYYSQCPWIVNILLTLAFTLMYLLMYHLIVRLKRKYPLFELLKPVLLFVMLVFILILSMVITAKFYYVPYISFFMVLTLFLGYCYDLFNPSHQ